MAPQILPDHSDRPGACVSRGTYAPGTFVEPRLAPALFLITGGVLVWASDRGAVRFRFVVFANLVALG